jgi:hypothetical protein
LSYQIPHRQNTVTRNGGLFNQGSSGYHFFSILFEMWCLTKTKWLSYFVPSTDFLTGWLALKYLWITCTTQDFIFSEILILINKTISTRSDERTDMKKNGVNTSNNKDT